MRKFFVSFLASALLPMTCWAENLYRVEIIVFMQPTSPASHVKPLDPVPDLGVERAVDFRRYFCLPAEAKPDLVQTFRSEEDVADCLNGYLLLNEIVHPLIAERIRLEKSGRYRILHHSAWQQPVSSPDEIHPVLVSNKGDIRQASASTPALDGTVLLFREQFLQLDIKLLYHYPSLTSGTGKQELDGLLLHASRKLRPNNLNYIDHPLIGILAHVTEVEKDSTPSSPADR